MQISRKLPAQKCRVVEFMATFTAAAEPSNGSLNINKRTISRISSRSYNIHLHIEILVANCLSNTDETICKRFSNTWIIQWILL